MYKLCHALFVGLTDAKAAASLPTALPDIPADIAIVEIFTVVLLAMKVMLQVGIVIPVSRLVGASEKDLKRISLSVSEIANYGSSFVIGFVLLQRQSWVWPSARWWVNMPDGSHLSIREDMRCYYLLYTARYVMVGISVVFIDKHAKDFVPMIIHHVVTVTVCALSYTYGITRVGLVCMVLFDFADVPLHLAKLCKYFLFLHKRMMVFCMDRMFEVFAIGFFVTRIVMFGYVCWSTHIESQAYLKHWALTTAAVALDILMVLQIYWMSLIVKVALRDVGVLSGDDPRSDSEDEGPEQNKKAQ